MNSARAFAKLKENFPEWEMVRTADNGMLGAHKILMLSFDANAVLCHKSYLNVQRV